jgi:hypothetical protein
VNHADPRLGNPDWPGNWTLSNEPTIELMNAVTHEVWICQTEMAPEQAAALAVPEGFGHALAGSMVAEAAYFSRSPGADVDGPTEEMTVGGFQFSRIARFGGLDALDARAGGPITDAQVWSIEKHHSMLYAAGRTIEILDFGDDTFATPAWAPPAHVQRGREVPSAWSIRTVMLVDDLIARIPNPARVAVFSDGSGFHGPLTNSILATSLNGELS